MPRNMSPLELLDLHTSGVITEEDFLQRILTVPYQSGVDANDWEPWGADSIGELWSVHYQYPELLPTYVFVHIVNRYEHGL